jgi:O-antigen/teichoic acid export membrane protein
MNIFLIFSIIGVDTLSTKYIAYLTAKEDKLRISSFYSKALILVTISSILISSIVFTGDVILEINYFTFSVSDKLLFIINMVLYTTLQYNIGILRGQKKIMTYSLIKNLGFVAFCFTSIVFCYFFSIKIDISTIIKVLLLSSVFLLMLSMKNIFKEISFVINENFSYKQIIQESIPLMLAGVATTLMGNVDVVMLKSMLNTEAVGIYDILIKVGTITTIVLMAVNAIAMPRFAELFGDEKNKDLEKVVRQTSTLIFWGTIPILIILFLFAKPILFFYFGDVADTVILSLRILLIGQMINTFCGSVGILLQMTNLQKYVQNILLIAVVLNIILNFILIPLYGILGAALSSAFSLSFWNIAGVIVANMKLKINTIYIPFYKI